MSIDNPGSFFSADDFKKDENSWKPIKINGELLYKKSVDILNLSNTICDLLEDEMTKGLIMQNAMVIPAKIRSAMAIDEVYSLVMENAVIVKVNICELNAQLWACEEIYGVEKKYIDVLREEIESFKKIFIDWVSSFDKANDHPDEWHLFNDPNDFPEEDDL